MSAEQRLLIFDTTLRDGEQSPGATMNLSEKVLMAQQLETLGVDIIEAGFAASSQGDFEAVSQIAKEVNNIRVTSLARAMESDIDKAAEAVRHAKNSRIHIFLATSPVHMEYKLRKSPAEVLAMAEASVRHACSCNADVEFACEDASRTDRSFLLDVCNAVVEAGAKTINIPDTVGFSQPDEFAELVEFLKKNVKNSDSLVFSVHCHNDLGLAVANSLAAVSRGARQVEVTVGGIGERAGNAALEELVMALTVRKEYYQLTTGIRTQQIYPTARLLSRIIGQPYSRNKPIVGANAFAHESGIHQAGMLSNPQTYEIMSPESIGLSNSAIVMGKHSGRNALKSKLEGLGYNLEADQVDTVFEAVKKLADKKKEIFDEDVEALILEKVYRIPDKFKLIHLSVNTSDSGVPPAAMVAVEILGERHDFSSFGVGPVDAIFSALSGVTGIPATLEQYAVNAISGGSDAQGEVTVKLASNGKKSVGRGSDADILYASARAYVNALNRLAKTSEEVA